MIKIVILTSRKNFVWKSMEEIIPFIENSWSALAGNKVQVKYLNIDGAKIKSLLVDIVDVSHLVISCFTPEIFQFINFTRSELHLNHRFIIHLHNQAAIGCWQMRYWGSPLLFKKTDIFIASCVRDAECLKISFPEAQVKIIPFSYTNIKANTRIPSLPLKEPIDLFFAGRLSSQKNLHTLIVSLYLLKKNFPNLNWKMHFYGAQDHLGRSNLGWEDNDYVKTLDSLVQHYQLEEEILFHGFVERTKLFEITSSHKRIFIAPSLHGDENFGMAAFRSLTDGHLAVLSNWGGHTDLKANFKEQVVLTEVCQSQNGPFINPLELMLKIKSMIKGYHTITSLPEVPDYYAFENITDLKLKLLKKSLRQEYKNELPLSPSPIAEEILSRTQDKKKVSEMRIFHGYNDPTLHPFLTAYGMSSPSDFIPTEDDKIVAYPWVNILSEKIIIDDPHRGKLEFPRSENISMLWLLVNGFAYQNSL